MTREQALAFVEACVTSPKVKSNLGAALGYKKVPDVPDFEATFAEAIERCEDFIAYLGEVHGVLTAIHHDRPKQQEIFGRKRKKKIDVDGVDATAEVSTEF